MMESIHKTCPICGHWNTPQKWHVNSFAIDECGSCETVFVRRRFSQRELYDWYAVESETYGDDNIGALNFYYYKLKAIIERRIPSGRLLDVGCSGGWFMDAMRDWDVSGIEISERDSLIAKEKHGDRVFHGTLDNYPDPAQPFDVITMQDVFDHMPDPLASLKKCHSMLSPGGLIVVKVHDIACLYARITGSKFYAVIPPYHLFYYNRKSLSIALSGSGFRVLESRHIAHILKIQTIFYRLSRCNEKSIWHKIYKAIKGSTIGGIMVRKNLHDIITIIAERV